MRGNVKIQPVGMMHDIIHRLVGAMHRFGSLTLKRTNLDRETACPKKAKNKADLTGCICVNFFLFFIKFNNLKPI